MGILSNLWGKSSTALQLTRVMPLKHYAKVSYGLSVDFRHQHSDTKKLEGNLDKYDLVADIRKLDSDMAGLLDSLAKEQDILDRISITNIYLGFRIIDYVKTVKEAINGINDQEILDYIKSLDRTMTKYRSDLYAVRTKTRDIAREHVATMRDVTLMPDMLLFPQLKGRARRERHYVKPMQSLASDIPSLARAYKAKPDEATKARLVSKLKEFGKNIETQFSYILSEQDAEVQFELKNRHRIRKIYIFVDNLQMKSYPPFFVKYYGNALLEIEKETTESAERRKILEEKEWRAAA